MDDVARRVTHGSRHRLAVACRYGCRGWSRNRRRCWSLDDHRRGRRGIAQRVGLRIGIGGGILRGLGASAGIGGRLLSRRGGILGVDTARALGADLSRLTDDDSPVGKLAGVVRVGNRLLLATPRKAALRRGERVIRLSQRETGGRVGSGLYSGIDLTARLGDRLTGTIGFAGVKRRGKGGDGEKRGDGGAR